MLIKISRSEIDLNLLKRTEDRINFNLFFLISQGEEVTAFMSRNRDFLALQNPTRQMWIWAEQSLNFTERKLLFAELLKLTENQNPLKMICTFENYELIAALIKEMYAVQPVPGMKMIPYYCSQNIEQANVTGRMIKSESGHKDLVAGFLSGFMLDCFGKQVTAESQLQDAEAAIEKGNLYLWQDDAEIVSMSCISHKTEEYARVNAVYTLPTMRGKGYGKMIISALNRMILDEGLTPVLYADATNSSSNSVYKNCGYIETGILQEFEFTRTR